MKKIGIFETNGKIKLSSFYCDYETIDISDMNGIYAMCSFENLSEIEKRLERFEEMDIYILGSGNFHYFTLPIIKKIKEKFILAVFDHHNDSKKLSFDEVTSCGSWIRDAIKYDKKLKHVYILGAGEEYKNIYDAELADKITVLYEKNLDENSINRLLSDERGENIYISVDRDILSKREIDTSWDQGDVKLEKLLNCIREVSKIGNILGLDICGDIEWDFHKVNNIAYRKKFINSVRINREIIETVR